MLPITILSFQIMRFIWWDATTGWGSVEPYTLIGMVLNSKIAQEHLVYLTENTIHRLQIIGIILSKNIWFGQTMQNDICYSVCMVTWVTNSKICFELNPYVKSHKDFTILVFSFPTLTAYLLICSAFCSLSGVYYTCQSGICILEECVFWSFL